MTLAIAPCPFCASTTAEIDQFGVSDRYAVCCDAAGCEALGPIRPTAEAAAAAWAECSEARWREAISDGLTKE